MWSFPSYDPNLLSTHDQAAANDARAALEPDTPHLAADPRRLPALVLPRLDLQGRHRVDRRRARRGHARREPVYPPASAFDIDFTDDELVELRRRRRAAAPCSQILARSAATPPSPTMGVDTIGEDGMVAGAEPFGFNERPPVRPARRRRRRRSPPTSPTTRATARSPGRRSARATSRPRRCRWRWSPPPSPTTAWSWRPTCSTGSPTTGAATVARARARGVAAAAVARRPPPPCGRRWSASSRTAAAGRPASPASSSAARPAPPSSAPTRRRATPGSSPSPARPDGPPEVAVAVIVEAQPGVSEVTGGRVAAPIARAVMEAVLNPGDSRAARLVRSR